jgi:macrodomain Ter protein organizer (MatP/YcbG family)
MSQRMPDYDAFLARESEAREREDGEQLAQAIRTRRKRKCIAEGAHTENCQRCVL